MNIIKNSKILKTATLILLGVVALVIIIWSVQRKSTTPQSGYSKTLEVSSTQPQVVIVAEGEKNDVSAEGDVSFSLVLEELNTRYPWLNKMPIETNEYLIVWELDASRFRIRLKISSNSSQNIKNLVLSKALADLKRVIEDDPNNYEYRVLYID